VGWPSIPTAALAAQGCCNPEFGYSVAVFGDTAVVGANSANSQAGEAYIYAKGSSGWPTTPTAILADPAATVLDYFGNALAVSGHSALVGASGTGEGTAYIFRSAPGG